MEHFCKQCQQPIGVKVACRPRLYCSNACKQLAYRSHCEEKKRSRFRHQWHTYSSASQASLEKLLMLYGEEAAQLATDALHHL